MHIVTKVNKNSLCWKSVTRLCSVSGAGDCLTAGFLAAMLRGADQHAAVAAGMQGRTDQHAAVAAGM